MHHHHIHRSRNRIAVTMGNHGQTIAHYRNVYPSSFCPFCRGVVWYRHIHHLLTGLLRLPDVLKIAFLFLGRCYGTCIQCYLLLIRYIMVFSASSFCCNEKMEEYPPDQSGGIRHGTGS